MMMVLFQNVEYLSALREREKERITFKLFEKDSYRTKSWTMNSPGFELERSETG